MSFAEWWALLIATAGIALVLAASRRPPSPPVIPA